MSPTIKSFALALLLALPAAVLAVPGVLGLDPLPHAAATGWALLLLAPAAIAGAFRQTPMPRATWLFLPPLAVTALALFGGDAADTFELRRATSHLVLSAAAFVLGAALDAGARRAFVRALMAVSLGFSLFAFLEDPAGTLGNSGTLSQAALPGAALGAFFLASSSSDQGTRLLGLLAAAAFARHAGTTPVLAGAIALGVALVASALLLPGDDARGRGARLILFLVALSAPLWFAMLRSSEPRGFEQLEGASETAFAADLGGGPVRLRVWNSTLELAGSSLLTGAGPGQFQREFPPYRDPAEIELSTWGRTYAAGNEVEHAHSDWLELLVEYGLVGGGALALLFVLGALGALRALRTASDVDRPRAAAATAILAIGAGAFLHSPLTYNPAAALPAFALLGMLLARRAETPVGMTDDPPKGTRLPALVALVLVLASLPTARSLIRHGSLLAERQELAAALAAHPNPMIVDERRAELWLEEGRVLREALEVAPDSTLALSLLAQHYRGFRESDSSKLEALDAWRKVLERRPHQVSALVGAGVLTNDSSERRELFERAVELDPGQPLVLSNLARLELFEGEPTRGLEYAARLDKSGRLEPLLVRDLAARSILAGHTDAGLELYARIEPELVDAIPEELFAASKREEGVGTNELLKDAFECAAHRRWGIGFAANGSHDVAVRKLRQALRITRRYLPAGDVPTLLLLAGSLAASGRADDARAELSLLPETTRPAEWSAVGEDARAALAELGYAAPD